MTSGLAVGGVLALSAALIAQAPIDPFSFFRPAVDVSARLRQAIDRGEAIAMVLPGQDREIAVFAALQVHVDGDRLVAWIRQIADLKKSAFVAAIGRFSSPPRIEDLERLTLDEDDLESIRRCRPGDCGLKLSAPEISHLQHTIAAARAEWKSSVQHAFRQVVLQRVQAYLREGHSASAVYNDHPRAVSLQTTFSSLLRRSVNVTSHLPRFADYLDRYPRAPMPEVESFIYWSKEQLAGKPVISATHVCMWRGREAGLPDALVAGKQVFATHYMNGSLGLTAIVRGPATHYLVYLNRSDVDVLGGFFGGLVRVVAERRLKAEASEVLQSLRQRLESGEPPAR